MNIFLDFKAQFAKVNFLKYVLLKMVVYRIINISSYSKQPVACRSRLMEWVCLQNDCSLLGYLTFLRSAICSLSSLRPLKLDKKGKTRLIQHKNVNKYPERHFP